MPPPIALAKLPGASHGQASLIELLHSMDEPWRDLRVGDRIRLVTMPSEFAQPGYILNGFTGG